MTDFSELLGKLSQIWPVRANRSFYEALMLPGDVLMDGEGGRTKPKVIGREVGAGGRLLALTGSGLDATNRPTKKLSLRTGPLNEDVVDFNWSDYTAGLAEIQRRLMDQKRKPDLKEPELSPDEANTIPGRSII